MIEGIKFLLLAFLTAFFSIKLSIYADALDKETKAGSLLIGGLFLAAITSFPELITGLTSIYINNIGLAIGDVLGSNTFNILIISFLNIFFLKSLFMNKISFKYKYLIGLLILIYLIILVTVNSSFYTHKSLSLISVLILFIYLFFIVLLSKIKISEPNIENTNIKGALYKFIIISLLLIIVSISLALQADKIFRLNTLFSSSTVGAFLLGITTSLPEVVSTYALISIGSYNLGFSNIIGSNAFNFCIFVICDLFVRGGHLYYFWDSDAFIFLKIGLLMHLILLFSIFWKQPKKYLLYLLPSIILLSLYFYMFYLQFS